MLAAILSILGSSTVGSLLGGIFAFLNRKTDLEVRRMELNHEASKWLHDATMRDKDLEYAQVEAQGKKDVAIVEADGAAEVARFQAIATAQAADRITAFNKLIRPVTTVVLLTASCYLNWLLIGKLVEVWPTLPKEQQYDAAMQAFAWTTGQASAVLGYWFVARGSSSSNK